jgi:lysophospholipase L1-like esterase
MLKEIHIEETKLKSLIENEATQAEAFKKYFYIDKSQSFKIEYKLKKNVIVRPSKGVHFLGIDQIKSIIIDFVNSIARNRRNKIYEENKRKFSDRICAVSEGDSWFQHPMVKDIVDHLLNHLNIYCLAGAGDTLSDIFRINEYSEAIERESPQIFLISGGGNDIFGDNFQSFLNSYTPGKNIRRLISDKFYDKLSDIDNLYNTFVSEMGSKYRKIKVIVHGYDYIIPGSAYSGKWVGKYMHKKNITDHKDKRLIIKEMVDRFNDCIESLSTKYSNVVYVNLRKTIHPYQWYDEIHPNNQGFQQAALKIMKKIY